MKVAIMYVAAQVDAEGHVTGHDAGATLVRRLLPVSYTHLTLPTNREV